MSDHEALAKACEAVGIKAYSYQLVTRDSRGNDVRQMRRRPPAELLAALEGWLWQEQERMDAWADSLGEVLNLSDILNWREVAMLVIGITRFARSKAAIAAVSKVREKPC